jgi:hypothetical protein
MIKLKEIISRLDATAYTDLEQQFIKTKADNFLYLSQSYRKGNVKDEEIITHLNLNTNSFYVLKSRLYTKIKKHISDDIGLDKEDVLNNLRQINEVCYNQPREIAAAFLEKLEEDLLSFDMHSELLVVYSALKKVNLQSENYFHYSQLYNKHVAFWLSLEKSEAILGNFTQILAEYEFSRSKLTLSKLSFLKQEILNHLNLNPSRQIEIIKNLADIQLFLFAGDLSESTFDVEKALNDAAQKIIELPDSSGQKKWQIALDYLYFEYYMSNGMSSRVKTLNYYQKLNPQLTCLLLFNNICLTPKFLLSKLQFLNETGQINDLLSEDPATLLSDPHDSYSKVMLGFYTAMRSYYSGKTKEAIGILNELLNTLSFKDLFHINTEIKLTLSYFYIQLKEFDMAENLTKSIYRKIKSEEELSEYKNVLDVIKLFGLEMNPDSKDRGDSRKKDAFILFAARNTGKHAVLNHLLLDLKKKFSV